MKKARAAALLVSLASGTFALAAQLPRAANAQNAPTPAFSNPHWDQAALEHGAVATMTVNVTNAEGRRVRFVVEQEIAGRWVPYATVTAVVHRGVATAQVQAQHPAQTRPVSEEVLGNSLRPAWESSGAGLRFRTELI